MSPVTSVANCISSRVLLSMKKKLFVFALLAVMMLGLFAGCAKQWTCDRCGKTWRGDAYYGSEYSDTLCPDCAGEYWFPLPINNYKK